MSTSLHFPKATIDRQGDSQILTVPAWHGKLQFGISCFFTPFVLNTWIHGFLQPLLSVWRGAALTLSAGQMVSGCVWTLVLLGLPYYLLYQWKGRLVLIAGPDRLLRIRDMVLFRFRREYLGMHIRNLRWSMPKTLTRPLGMRPAEDIKGSILCEYQGRTVALTGVLPAQYGKPLVDALSQIYAKSPKHPAESNLGWAMVPLSSRTEIQTRNGTLRIRRSGRNVRQAAFLTILFAGWMFFEIFLLNVVLNDQVSSAGAGRDAFDLIRVVMIPFFLVFWSLGGVILVPNWLFSVNGWEVLEVDDVDMHYRKRSILFSYSRRYPRQVPANFRITDTGLGDYEGARDRQTRASWGESSLALAFDAAGKTKRIFLGTSQQDFDAITEALASFNINLAKPDSGSSKPN